MPHRDPETGQFVAHDQYSDIEVASFEASIGIEAGNLAGGAGFTGGDAGNIKGMELLDYDEFVDRNEELRLLEASHRMTVYANSTETEDGTVRAYTEIAAQPSFVMQNALGLTTDSPDGDAAGDVVGRSVSQDSIDLLGRPLVGMAGAPFSDTGTGVGGAGTEGDDSWQSSTFPAEFGRFHPRDEMFLNASFEVWNIDDAGIHLDVTGQHIYGVVE